MGHKNEGKDTFVLNGGTKMTIKIVSVVVLCLLSAFSAFAQNDQGDNIGGGGTTNYIPVFTGSHKIGNSKLFQSAGYVGIGTTTPRNVSMCSTGITRLTHSGLNPSLFTACLQTALSISVLQCGATHWLPPAAGMES